MAFAVFCPVCRADVPLSSEPKGQPVCCPACQYVFLAKAEPFAAKRPRLPLPPLPPLRARDIDGGEEDDSRIQPRVLARMALHGGGIVVAAVLVVATVSWYSTSPPVPPQLPPLTLPVLAPDASPDAALAKAEKALTWRVVPDPAPPEKPPAVNAQASMTLARNQTLVFPAGSSRFVCVGPKVGGHDPCRIWDLASMTAFGSVPPAAGAAQRVILSADGQFVAGSVGNPTNDRLLIWPTRGAEEPVKIDGPHGRLVDLRFAGSAHLLACTQTAEGWEVHVWDVATGSPRRRFAIAKPFDSQALACSAGGKFLAVISRERKLIFYDLVRGDTAGTVVISESPKTPILACAGMAFSPDGASLATVFEEPDTVRLLTWDLQMGKVSADHRRSMPVRMLINAIASSYEYGKVVEWSPDQPRCLIHGQIFIDLRSGGHLWTVPQRLADAVRFVAPRYLAAIQAHPADRVLTVLPVPPEVNDGEARPGRQR